VLNAFDKQPFINSSPFGSLNLQECSFRGKMSRFEGAGYFADFRFILFNQVSSTIMVI
jgi:hypothetical protein